MNVDLRRTSAPGFQEVVEGRRPLDAPSAAFPYSEVPRFLFDSRLGLPPRDLEAFRCYWLISNQLKTVLERVDPEGLSFLGCDVLLPNGADGGAYWLCDVIRILDAVDETVSKLRIYDENGLKTYSLRVRPPSSSERTWLAMHMSSACSI
jgi:hypothetical protein